MAFKRNRSKGDSKYLRLTGLWQSKSNDALWTGRLKEEQVGDLLEKVEEAQEAGAPIVFSLWENDKKESKRDPEFSLQCFVGDTEEKPRSRRDRDERGSRKSKHDEDEDESENDNEEEDNEPEEEEEEEKPRRRSKTSKTSKGSSSKKRKSESW